MRWLQYIQIVLLLLLGIHAQAQTVIRGHVKRAVPDSSNSIITLRNVNSGATTMIDSSGKFEITVKSNDLLEFSCINIQTLRVRIVNEKSPLYYSIVVKPKQRMLEEITAVAQQNTYSEDSLITYRTYRTVFDKPGLSDYNLSTGIMASLSKRQRQEWEFRQSIIYWEQEKYIDSKFGERVIAKMTGLQGDSLLQFIQLFKPSYNDLRIMNEYNYLKYVKTCLAQYCRTCVFIPPTRYVVRQAH